MQKHTQKHLVDLDLKLSLLEDACIVGITRTQTGLYAQSTFSWYVEFDHI